MYQNIMIMFENPELIEQPVCIRLSACINESDDLSTGHPVPSRQGDLLREGFFPHLVGGFNAFKSLLFSPYPASRPRILDQVVHIPG